MLTLMNLEYCLILLFACLAWQKLIFNHIWKNMATGKMSFPWNCLNSILKEYLKLVSSKKLVLMKMTKNFFKSPKKQSP